MTENTENAQPVENIGDNTDDNTNAQSEGLAQPIDMAQQLKTQLKEAEQKYVYLYADFENFKKRVIKERQDIIKFGWEPVASELLPVLDNFERALQYTKPDTDPNLISGLQMVISQFRSALEKQGVKIIPAMDQPFNPDLHESVGEVSSTKPQGTIVQEHVKGYTLHGRLLRPSKVMISNGSSAGTGQN